MSGLVLTALDRIQEHQAAAKQAGNVALHTELQLQHAELEDRCSAIEQEASFSLARTATGALFQAMVASNEVHSVGESTLSECDRRAIERRIQRCLFSVVRFLGTIGGAKMERVRQHYAPEYLDPFAAGADALAKAQTNVAAFTDMQEYPPISAENSEIDRRFPPVKKLFS